MNIKSHKHITLIDLIIKKGKWIEAIFTAAVICSCIAACFVEVNYDLSEYLPSYAPSKAGLNLMEEEFGYPGTARVMIGPVSLYEAKTYKDQIAQIDGVDIVMWADTSANIYGSNSFIDYDDIRDYYRDDYAVMDIIFENGDSDTQTRKAISRMQSMLGDRGYLAGSAVQNKSLDETLKREISLAMAMGVFMIAAVLCLTTTSWFEPVMFLMIMGIAILINMGTNIIIHRISFLTFSVAAILQLAVAMDYSVFLLHSYIREKAAAPDKETAMARALRNSLSSILASGATTIVGFVVLMLMRFTIGKDMGFVLAKGIVISLLTVIFLMPTLILKWGDKVEKTTHRQFVPSSYERVGRLVYKVRYAVLAAIVILVIPAFSAQNMNQFIFGNSALGSSPGTQVYEDEQQMNGRFGKSNLVLVLIPNTSMVKEKELSEDIEDLYYTKSVTSLASTLPVGVPESILPRSAVSLMHTEHYSRIMVYIKTSDESEFAFQCSDEIRELVAKYYPQDSYVTGVTPSTQDIKEIITKDYSFVNILSTLGVALVVMVTFKSLLVPVVVLIPIEVAIFFNMALPYFAGENMLYLGYIIVSCLQLGATVDYSILMTNNYVDIRQTCQDKITAIVKTISLSLISILTSGLILTIVGYGLYLVSSVQAIADLGHLIGRGAVISMFMVVFLLPVLLVAIDKELVRARDRVCSVEVLKAVCGQYGKNIKTLTAGLKRQDKEKGVDKDEEQKED